MAEATVSDVNATPIGSLSAVIVHHRRHDAIGEVVRGVLRGGVSANNLVVVDNSEMPDLVPTLRSELPEEVQLEIVTNRGYGAAVNAGLRSLKAAGKEGVFTLVATHEVKLDSACLHRLVSALDDPSLTAVGPELLTDNDEAWSMGGTFSRVLGLPIHRLGSTSAALANGPVECGWLDGAVVVYRTRDLPVRPFDESFFLYTEEVDLHLRLGYAGGKIAVVPGARAWQQSDGTPPFYFARNLRLLNRRHRGLFGRTVGTALPILRRLAGLAARQKWSAVRDLCRGAVARLPVADSRVILVNPLGATLRHYAMEARQVLGRSDISTDCIQFYEPSASGRDRLSWLLDYVSALRMARRLGASMQASSLIVCWPVLGMLDAAIVRIMARTGILVVHDPKPLVRAVGYGRLSILLANAVAKQIHFVTHSRHAQQLLAQLMGLSIDRVEMVPHPIATLADRPTSASTTRISVLGQYKPDRDTTLLKSIASTCDRSWQLQVIGRGWPQIEGWDVDARFVTEAEFDEQLRKSAVVLIPYRRFYQSGVAIRALEAGTAVVGPRASVLSDVLGPSSPWLADDDPQSWIDAIEAAVTSADEEVVRVRELYTSRAVSAWAKIARKETLGDD